MNKHWVRHFVREHGDAMEDKSLMNCHAPAFDSILFDDTPGARIRLFVAHPAHNLWTNTIRHWYHPATRTEMSCSPHPHHCDVELHVVQGTMMNMPIRVHEGASEGFRQYRWDSPIQGGTGSFVATGGTAELKATAMDIMFPGDTAVMPAAQYHTVAVDRGKPAAWFVFEGREDPDYKPLCYSNGDLTQFKTEGLYIPFSTNPGYMTEVLESVFGSLDL